MRILQLTKKYPFPAKDGESIAILNLAKALNSRGHEVHLLAMNTLKHYIPNTDNTRPILLECYSEVKTEVVDNRVKLVPAFLNLFSTESYHISRFKSPAFSRLLENYLLDFDFDIVQLETPYLAPYIPLIRRCSTAKVCMRAHNVEFEIWERLSSQSTFGPKKWYVAYLTNKLRRYELKQLSLYDGLLPITKRDALHFQDLGYNGPLEVIPVGLEMDNYPEDYSSFDQSPSVGFIGSLDWAPNLEGLHWFIKNIWPKLKKEHPELKFHIAGRNPSEETLALGKDPQIIIHGEVDSAVQFMLQHSLHVVPLLSGGGMRVKVLEAMALGRVVLSTSVGVEGIFATPEKEILLADSSEIFLQKLADCIQQKYPILEIAKAARNRIEQDFVLDEIGGRLSKFYQEELR